jgi:alanyl-tRNA synthetase
MSNRLYYFDSYLAEFDANAIENRPVDGRTAVILDSTAFYPASGGQPHDTGTLGSACVEEILEAEDGEVLHFVDAPLTPGPIHGVIDWRRRFDHMQQHTGQHILSQSFIHVAGAGTVSFHMGAEVSTIDIELEEPSVDVMERVEQFASRIVFEDRPVNLLFVDREQQESLGLRKTSEREGKIRVVEIEKFDRSPCGGTHVKGTGEIGMISILGFERYKGGTRVEFVCGERARRTFHREHETLRELGRLFSAHPLESPRLVEALRNDKAVLGKEVARLQNLLLDAEARELLAAAGDTSGIRLICREFSDRTIEGIRLLAQKVTKAPAAVTIFALAQDPAQVIVAAGPATGVDCGAILRETIALLGGKGGGKPGLAQGGGIPLAALPAWLDAVRCAVLKPR